MIPEQTTTLLERLLKEKKTAIEFQKRKHLDWNENYTLYRNKVQTNRLTQRQAVNIPLMKETVKTILSKIDDAPNVDWKEKSGDELKELIYQEMWAQWFKDNKFEWKDIIDKKNVLLYGLSTKKLNPTDKGIDVSIPDVYDIIYDPLTVSIDIETARFIIHQNIYKSLRDILADDRYTTKGKDQLKIWATTDAGIIQTQTNKEEMDKKNERLLAMGVNSSEFANFSGGDVIVNLTEHFSKQWNEKTNKFERRVTVYADDHFELLNEPLKDLIGVDFWPFVMWSEDPETNDIYPDGVADLVRVPNKIINIFLSQQTENRTLQNFQMHWYDASQSNYIPQTYEPGPGRMLPAPGDPSKSIMPVQINGLDEAFASIEFLTKIVERGSGAVAVEKGQSDSGEQTLGEVKVLVGKAMERTVAMAKFYRGSWYELAKKWDAMMQANPPKKTKLYKTGRSGKIYEKIVYAGDWKSEAGYEPTVSSTSEQEQEQTKTLQKFMFVISQFPNNIALRKIAQKRELESLDLTPDELKTITDEEEKMQMQMQTSQPQQTQPAQQSQQPNQTPQLMNDIQNQMQQLQGA